MSVPGKHQEDILVVDDDPSSLRILTSFLAKHSYQVRSAVNAKSALEAVHQKPPDLILLDVRLPDMDGYALCRKLKTEEGLHATPVIFISGLTETLDKVKGFEAGGVDYVTKPIRVQEVLVRVKTQIGIKTLQSQLEENNRQLQQEIEERQRAEAALQKAHDELETKVAQRTADLVAVNEQLKHEIAERKQIEAALRASEERYRTLYRDNPTMFFTLDRDGVVISVNTFGASQLGYTIDELVGHSVLKVFYEEDHAAVKTQLGHCIQNLGQIERWQFRKVRKDGSLLWVEEFARALTDPNGDIYVLVVCQDITDRKQAQLRQEQLLAQIREQAQQVKNIIDTVQEGVILLSQEQSVTLANPVAKQYLSLLAPDWENNRLDTLGTHPLRTLLTSPPQGLWHEITFDDRQFGIIAHPVENGPLSQGWVLVLRDITQERIIQRRIQKQERLVAVGQLAAGIAHDFNNILSVITLYANLALHAENLSPQLKNRLQIIEEQAQRATNLIQQILDFSRQSIMKRQPLDMVDFLEKLINLLKRTLPESLHITFSHDEDEYIINADLTRMQQVFMNLAVNARDALPDGGRLSFTLSRIHIPSKASTPLANMPPGQWVKITVTDNGQGIPPDALSHIFEPFFTTKEVGKGTGLGLAQVYGIVQQHDGFIDVASEAGRGTTFSLYFPMHLTREPAGSQNTVEDLPKGQGQMVLVVEDEPAIRHALAESLTLLNYTVMEAANGVEALSVLQEHSDKIALVLSDVVMPEMGGKALFRAVRELGLNVPFAMMTGHAVEHDIAALQDLGLREWIAKPPDLGKLAGLLARIFGQNAE